MKIRFASRAFVLGALAVASTVSVPTLGLRRAFAHEAPCPYCNISVSDDTASVLNVGRKRIEYKCVYCALAEAQSEYKGDLKVTSPSEKKGQPVVLKRTSGGWSALPASAFFVMPARLKHKICQAQARAFTTQAAATAFAKSSGGEVLNLAQMNARVK